MQALSLPAASASAATALLVQVLAVQAGTTFAELAHELAPIHAYRLFSGDIEPLALRSILRDEEFGLLPGAVTGDSVVRYHESFPLQFTPLEWSDKQIRLEARYDSQKRLVELIRWDIFFEFDYRRRIHWNDQGHVVQVEEFRDSNAKEPIFEWRLAPTDKGKHIIEFWNQQAGRRHEYLYDLSGRLARYSSWSIATSDFLGEYVASFDGSSLVSIRRVMPSGLSRPFIDITYPDSRTTQVRLVMDDESSKHILQREVSQDGRTVRESILGDDELLLSENITELSEAASVARYTQMAYSATPGGTRLVHMNIYDYLVSGEMVSAKRLALGPSGIEISMSEYEFTDSGKGPWTVRLAYGYGSRYGASRKPLSRLFRSESVESR